MIKNIVKIDQSSGCGTYDLLPYYCEHIIKDNEALKAVKKAYDVEPVNMPLAGGSLPNYVFTDILQMPTISVPYGNPDENNHAPNENFKLSCYFSGIHATAQVLYELGTLVIEA